MHIASSNNKRQYNNTRHIILLTLHITPSQSKMNTSTPGNKSFAGSLSLSTLALSDVLLLLLRFADIILLFLSCCVVEEDTRAEDTARVMVGEKARTDG